MFGNYAERELARSFVHAHDRHYSRYRFNTFECMAWLLTDDAAWMPQRLREALLEGFRKRDFWYQDVLSIHNAFAKALLTRTRSSFSFTRKIRSALVELLTSALRELSVQEDPMIVAERFIARRFVDGYYDWQDEIRVARRERRQ